MKTRREFLKTLLGGTAVLATAVLAPVSLMAKPKQETHMLNASETVGPTQLEEMKYATSGYMQVEQPIEDHLNALPNEGRFTIARGSEWDNFHNIPQTITVADSNAAGWIKVKHKYELTDTILGAPNGR